jgi:hypothetical protein
MLGLIQLNFIKEVDIMALVKFIAFHLIYMILITSLINHLEANNYNHDNYEQYK